MVSTRRCHLQRGAAIRARDRVHCATSSRQSKFRLSHERTGGVRRGGSPSSSKNSWAARQFMATANFVRQTQAVLQRKKRTPRTNPDRGDTDVQNEDGSAGDAASRRTQQSRQHDDGGGDDDGNDVGDGADVVADSADVVGDGADVVADSADVVADGADVVADGADVVADGADVVADGADVVADGADGVADSADGDGVADGADGGIDDDDDGHKDGDLGDDKNDDGNAATSQSNGDNQNRMQMVSPSSSTRQVGRRTGTRLKTEAADLRRDLVYYGAKAGSRMLSSPSTSTRSHARADSLARYPQRLCSLQRSNAPPKTTPNQHQPQQQKRGGRMQNPPSRELRTRSCAAAPTAPAGQPPLTRRRAAADSVLSSSSPPPLPATRPKGARIASARGKTEQPPQEARRADSRKRATDGTNIEAEKRSASGKMEQTVDAARLADSRKRASDATNNQAEKRRDSAPSAKSTATPPKADAPPKEVGDDKSPTYPPKDRKVKTESSTTATATSATIQEGPPNAGETANSAPSAKSTAIPPKTDAPPKEVANPAKKRKVETESSATATATSKTIEEEPPKKIAKGHAKKPTSKERNTPETDSQIGKEKSSHNPAKSRKTEHCASTTNGKKRDVPSEPVEQATPNTVAAAVAAATAALLAVRRKRNEQNNDELDEEEEAWWSSSDDIVPMHPDGSGNDVERRNWFACRTIEQLCGRYRRRCRLSRQGKIGTSRWNRHDTSQLNDLVVEKESRKGKASIASGAYAHLKTKGDKVVPVDAKRSGGAAKPWSKGSQLQKVGYASVRGGKGTTKPVGERSKGSSRAHQSPLSVLETTNGIGSDADSILSVASKQTPSVWCVIQIPPQATPGQRFLVSWPDGSQSEVQCPTKLTPCRRIVVVKPGSPPPSQPAESVKLTNKEWTRGVEARLRQVYSTGFFTVVWPTLQSLGWTAVEGDETGTGGRYIIPPPAGGTTTNSTSGSKPNDSSIRDATGRFRDYYVRLNDVLFAIAPLTGEYAHVFARFQAYLYEQELKRKERQERRKRTSDEPVVATAAAAALSSCSSTATARDEESTTKEKDKKYLSPSTAPNSPGGKDNSSADYELPHLPPAGSYRLGSSSEGRLYDRIWDPAKATPSTLSFLDQWKSKDKELVLLALHQADYQVKAINMPAASTAMMAKRNCVEMVSNVTSLI